jgi:DNA repair exonuclease SbcCD ATPase subunit
MEGLMNDLTTTGTAIALPNETALATVLKDTAQTDSLAAKIRAAAFAEAKGLDPASAKDRERLRSIAYKLSQTKAEAERQRKALTEKSRKEVAAINAGGIRLEESLATLRDEIRKPAVDWEAAEEARKQALEERLKDCFSRPAPTGSAEIRTEIERVEAIALDDSWQEKVLAAELAKVDCLERLNDALAAANAREEQERELARQREELEQLRREKAEREERERCEQEERDRKAREEQEAKEREETLRRINEQAAEKKRQEEARLALEREAAAKKAREDAERAAAEREADLARQLQAQKEATERAAQAERDRIAEEQRQAKAAEEKRRADQEHRTRVRDRIFQAIEPIIGDRYTAGATADALMEGKIPHIEVRL